MADNLSDYAENALVAHSVGKAAFTLPSVYLALFTVTPTDVAASGTEVSTAGTAYARQSVPAASWGAASAGAITTVADVLFAVATGAYGTVVAIALFDAVTGGNMIWYGPLTVSKAIASGEQFKMPAGQLTASLA